MSLAVEDPRHFLQRVMGDESVELQRRIEAAKALLPHRAEHRFHREEGPDLVKAAWWQ